jgi:nucleotide-binding universal stress UspA family protein
MIKTILVPVTGNDIDATSFAAALPIARAFAAHVDALHVRVDPIEVAMTMSTEGAGGVLLQGIIDDLTRDADANEAKARSKFVDLCAKEALVLCGTPADAGAKPSAEWHVETGQEPRWVTSYGMTADLIVAPRGIPGQDATARATLEALLLETGRPLMVPGSSPVLPRLAERIAIAWKATPQASRAVAGAMPFLARAKEVVVLSVEEEAGRRDDADRLVAYLGWHGVTAAVERLSPGPHGAAETMLAAATARAELLVMGGYGHTRLREWVFGGFTQRVLSEAPLPVLIAH